MVKIKKTKDEREINEVDRLRAQMAELEARAQAAEAALSEPHTEAQEYLPTYGDLSQLNQDGLILSTVGKERLRDIVTDYLDLLETSAAVYERNGDYAMGLFSSSWCRMMDTASRALCDTDDNRAALACGRWLCHQSCWEDASLPAIQTGEPVDIACSGGIRLYAVPILVDGNVVGALNFGYGDPPTDEAHLRQLAEQYQLPIKNLQTQARAYQPRPGYIIDYAKKRAQRAARYIGSLIKRQQLESNLRDHQDKLQAVMTHSTFQIIEIDLDGNILLVNQAAAALAGDTPENLVGKTITAFVPDKLGETFMARINQVKGTGEPLTVEDRLKLPVGERVLYTTMYPILDDSGVIHSIGAITQDITERKQAEEALRISEERLDLAMRVKNEGIWDWDLTTNQADFDDRYYTMAGYQPGEFPHHLEAFQERVHPEDIDSVMDTAEKYISGQLPAFHVKFRFKHKSGSWMWIEGKGKIFEHAEDGQPKRFVGTHTDITEQVQAQRALRESEERFRIVQEISPDGFTILHPERNEQGEVVDFSWVYENQSVARINKTDPQDVIGKRILDLFPAHLGTSVFEAYLFVANTGKSQVLEDVYVGEIISRPTWLRLVVVPMGEDIAILTQDITERKRSEDQLRQLKQDLEVQVAQKTAELQERVAELELFFDATVEREFRMQELREELARLKAHHED